jgi:hypothetical protein
MDHYGTVHAIIFLLCLRQKSVCHIILLNYWNCKAVFMILKLIEFDSSRHSASIDDFETEKSGAHSRNP